MAATQISVINSSTVLSDDDVKSVVPALQQQVTRDFYPQWGADAALTFVPQGSNPAPGSWWLVILDDSDQANALGYHDLTSEGLPISKVFAGSDLKLGTSWTVTASHELLEMLADPDINLTVLVQADNTTGRLYAYEVCDACEDDSFGYQINGVLVSDFVYPSWFESFWAGKKTQFDFQKNIDQPFQLLKGGYIGIFDITAGAGWTQLTAQEGVTTRERGPVGSRRERRRTARHLWVKSTSHADIRKNAETYQKRLAKAMKRAA
ncbi:MAG TPA: hypothetical protein VFI95_22160 [Terriglobales bacterium]|nr:hypothetical protein [Terriglobales bacterium]